MPSRERHGVSNHGQLDCLSYSLEMRQQSCAFLVLCGLSIYRGRFHHPSALDTMNARYIAVKMGNGFFTWDFTGDRWTPNTKGQLWEKHLHLMLSSLSFHLCAKQGRVVIQRSLLRTWRSNHLPSKLRDEIIYPFRNSNGCTAEVSEWISNFTSQFILDAIAYPWRD